MSDSPVSPTRRSFLASIALPAAATGALVLPAVLASATAAEPHPDAALFAAEAAYKEAEAAWLMAREAHQLANEAYDAALGPCPLDLVALRDEAWPLEHPGAPYEVRCCRSFRWVGQTAGDTGPLRKAWTTPGLNMAIRHAVPIFGVGGQTPHRIRRWRSLLPVAEAFDARADALEARFRIRELSVSVRETDKARIAAEVRFGRISAKTVEGLAAKVRHMDASTWMGMGAPWVALFQSAAAVAGVKLREPRFDCERWAREVREAGGSIRWDDVNGEGHISLPVDCRHTAEHKVRLTRLSGEQRVNREEIAFWLSQRGGAA